MACTPTVLRQVPLFALLDDEETAVLASQVEMRNFVPLQRIYKMGEPCCGKSCPREKTQASVSVGPFPKLSRTSSSTSHLRRMMKIVFAPKPARIS